MAGRNKDKSRKVVSETVRQSDHRDVVAGELRASAGRPRRRLFRYIGEKLPFACLTTIHARRGKKRPKNSN